MIQFFGGGGEEGEREFGSQNKIQIISLKCLKWFSGQKETNYLSKMCQVVS